MGLPPLLVCWVVPSSVSPPPGFWRITSHSRQCGERVTQVPRLAWPSHLGWVLPPEPSIRNIDGWSRSCPGIGSIEGLVSAWSLSAPAAQQRRGAGGLIPLHLTPSLARAQDKVLTVFNLSATGL